MTKPSDVELLLKELKIPFKDILHYQIALAHISFVNENRSYKLNSYDRYEFLGDTILDFIISSWCFKNMPDYNSGQLTLKVVNIVRKESLAVAAEHLNLRKYALLGNGEIRETISESIMSDFLESFIAAMYLDIGIEFTQKFVVNLFEKQLNEMTTSDDLKDYKTKLQELLQQDKRTVLYTTERIQISPTKYEFETIAYIDGLKYGQGKGLSKREAEKEAAKKAFEKLVV